jgi:hypothetical protein
VMIEELINAENNPFATIVIDPLGNFATMKIPNRSGEIETWNKAVKKQKEVEPKGMDPKKLKILIPQESVTKFDKLMYDSIFSISPMNLTDDLLGYAFDFDPLDAQASLYHKVRYRLIKESKESKVKFSLDDIINEVSLAEYHPQTKDSLIRKLESLRGLGLVTNEAPEIYDLVKSNECLIFNLSQSSTYTNRIIVNFFAKQLMEYRSLITSKINLAKIKLELEEKNWRQYNDWYIPPVKLIIDEAHEFLPNNPTLATYIKKGRNLGCTIGFISQSADLNKSAYANLSHLFIGPMRFDEDINTLRALTATERSPDNFKKLVKQQKNGCFVYYNLNELDSEKVIKVRPRMSLHPAGNKPENERKYIITPEEKQDEEPPIQLEEDLESANYWNQAAEKYFKRDIN